MTLTTLEQFIFDWVDALLPDIKIIDQHSDDATVDINRKDCETWAKNVAQSIKTEQLPLLKQLNELLTNKHITKRVTITQNHNDCWNIKVEKYVNRVYWPILTIELPTTDEAFLATWLLIQHSKSAIFTHFPIATRNRKKTKYQPKGKQQL